MVMRYDLIVVGAGPAGLMAAKTAAEDGLKVLLVERKRDITEINRLCAQFASINFSVSGTYGQVDKYGYLEPISLEVGTDKNKVHFLGPGFSIDYNGPLRPYFNMICFSQSGYRVYRERAGTFFGFFWEKESLLVGLLAEAEGAGAEVLIETMCLGAENTSDGVKVFVRGKSGEQTLEAKKAIAADGSSSRIVDSLGLNEKRQAFGKLQGGGGAVGYVMEGIETEYRLNSWLNFSIPDITRRDLFMWMVSGDRNVLCSGSGSEAVEKFMRLPFYEPWFRNARVVKKLAATTAVGIRTAIMEPVAGNVLIVGDAAAFIEATILGAIACGYQGAKATFKELNGQKGYPEYVKWWQKVIETNCPGYSEATSRYYTLNRVCSSEEIDYLYHLVQGQEGLPALLVAKNLERVKGERPELYTKLKETGIEESVDDVDKVKMDLFQVLGTNE